ncbi:RidA family protein [Wohlfahrtiimonas chitiniclastica]|uniref:RidA family protein n=1 Tax=Wohlfahrtiimonas chitiniclastica TaxID=400946 RepID=A0AB35BZ38_9GAMM|nr:RidA family protein [Wohlfahrtiimonas chitiniclastica]MBS7824994.1 RidA family protein [Wohlfahrtiimonas chitiniclastica]MBS7841110.1 RidA family protein [Wohlfahrtiimonas chitiniclastica]
MIKRFNIGPRMCDAAIYNQTLYYTSVPLVDDNCAHAQMTSILKDIDDVLAKNGSEKSKILDVTIFLVNPDDFDEMNRAWDEWVDAQNPPVRCTVQAGLMRPEWKMEVKVIAAV